MTVDLDAIVSRMRYADMWRTWHAYADADALISEVRRLTEENQQLRERLDAKTAAPSFESLRFPIMQICPQCGSKRCPLAHDGTAQCIGSTS